MIWYFITIYLNVSCEEAMKRALGRITCPECKRGYNKYFDDMKPKNENLCDDVIYLIEPSIIKLNKMMLIHKDAFDKLYNKKILKSTF